MPVAEIITFDTAAQIYEPQRIIAWISFFSNPNTRIEPLEFVLPRKVATRYITAVFLDAEYYPRADEQRAADYRDVNCQAINISG